jgi:hypothetical protein
MRIGFDNEKEVNQIAKRSYDTVLNRRAVARKTGENRVQEEKK